MRWTVSRLGLVPRMLVAVLAGMLLAGTVAAGPAAAQDPPPNVPCPPNTPEAEFDDRDQARTGHGLSIDCVAFHAIAQGSTTPAGDRVYNPAGIVNRAQMATFIANTLDAVGADLPDGDAPDTFTDIADTVHRARINALARAGIVAGYGDDSYRPNQTVTRAQMATFIVQAAEWALDDDLDAEHGPYFADTAGNTHEANIDAGFEAGLYHGHVAPDPDTPRSGTYGPHDGTRRDQMATFLSRLLDHLWGTQGIAGLVTDAGTSHPIPGAIVTIEAEPADPETDPRTVNTDEQGFYLADLDPGSYTVAVVADDFEEPEPRTGVTVSANALTTVNFELEPYTPVPPTEPDPGVIRGRVLQANTQVPVADASVTVLADSTEVGSTTADPQGNYDIAVRPGTYTVVADAPGYLPRTEDDVVVVSDDNVILDFALLFEPDTATLTADRELAPTSEIANPREEALSRGDINFVLTLYDEVGDPIDPTGYAYTFSIHNTGAADVWACVRCEDEGNGTDAMLIPAGGKQGLSGIRDINRVRVDAADPASVIVVATAALVDHEATGSATWISVDHAPTGTFEDMQFDGSLIAFDYTLGWYLMDANSEIVYIEYSGDGENSYMDGLTFLSVTTFEDALATGLPLSYENDAQNRQLHWLNAP